MHRIDVPDEHNVELLPFLTVGPSLHGISRTDSGQLGSVAVADATVSRQVTHQIAFLSFRQVVRHICSGFPMPLLALQMMLVDSQRSLTL